MSIPEQPALFELDRIRKAPQVATLEFHPTIGSTNDRALELIRAGGVTPPLLILAGEQTSGRGRGDHRWWSSAGALTFSYVTRPPRDFDRARWPRLALVAAVAVCDVIEELAPALKPGIRWPNDVHVAGKKACGILVEVPGATNADGQLLVLGLGLNVNNSLADAPPEVRAVGTSLTDLTGKHFDLTDVLLRLLDRLELQTARVAAGDDEIVSRWRQLCLLTGRRVTLRVGERDAVGRCQGIADDGALVLETQTGRERFFGGVLTRVE
jgi:BirA family biotin operon repressor/biotin-[acetyl-CoA-carboxylase] ligase